MNSGKVQLDVIIKGKDEVAAMLANIEKQAKQTEKQLKEVADSQSKVGGSSSMIDKAAASFAAFNAGVDRADEVMGKFKKAWGLAGDIYDVVKALVDFIGSLDKLPQALKNARDASTEAKNVILETRDLLDQIAIKRAPTEAQRKLLEIAQEENAIGERMIKIASERGSNEGALLKLQKERKELAGEIEKFESGSFQSRLTYAEDINKKREKLLEVDGQIKLNMSAIDASMSLQKELAGELVNLENDRKQVLIDQGKQMAENVSGMIAQISAGGSFVGKALANAGSSFAEGVGNIADKAIELFTKPKPKAGGPRRKTLAEIGEERTRERIENDIRTTEALARLAKTQAEQEAAQAKLQEALSALEDMQENQAILEEEIRLFGEYTDGIYGAADAFDTLSKSLGKSLDLFPEIGDGFRGVQEAMQKHAEFVKANEEQVAQGFMTSAEAITAGEESKTKAIISGSTEGLAAIGKLVGGLKAEYALRSAGELAMGFATLANPVESAGHFVAAGLFAVAAGKAASGGGGKGASAAGADSEAPATSSSLGYGDGGGQRTVVYNFSTLLADRQQVHRAIRDSELVGQRNGYGRRRGV